MHSQKERFILYPYASWYFALAMLITWIGFSTSYFARLNASSIYHHLHGATAGLWIVLLIIQPLLYKYNKLKLHRKLGRIASIILVPLLVVGGLKMIQMMIQRQNFYPPGEVYRLSFIDFYSLIQFLLFFGLSLYHSKRVHLHARYMTCTVLTLLPPAITRLLFFIPGLDTFTKTLNVSFICVEVVLLILIWDDKRSGSFRKPYFYALIIFGLLHILMNFAGGWQGWRNLMDSYSETIFIR